MDYKKLKNAFEWFLFWIQLPTLPAVFLWWRDLLREGGKHMEQMSLGEKAVPALCAIVAIVLVWHNIQRFKKWLEERRLKELRSGRGVLPPDPVQPVALVQPPQHLSKKSAIDQIINGDFDAVDKSALPVSTLLPSDIRKHLDGFKPLPRSREEKEYKGVRVIWTGVLEDVTASIWDVRKVRVRIWMREGGKTSYIVFEVEQDVKWNHADKGDEVTVDGTISDVGSYFELDNATAEIKLH